MNDYLIALTLEVEADNEHDALILAATAAEGMQGSPGVQHCHIAYEAEPLFADQPFAQIRGQIGFTS